MKKVEVFCKWAPSKRVHVGTLAQSDRRIYFEYDSTFLKSGLELSPYHLPAGKGLFEEKRALYNGLHGLFADSLPDGWGMLLLKRKLMQLGVDIASTSPLDLLSILGDRTSGALVYEPARSVTSDQDVSLEETERDIVKVIEGDAEDVLPVLFDMGGSPQGARPKITVGFDGERLTSRANDLPPGYESWLIKFPAKTDDRDAGAVEYLYAKIAAAAGLDMPATRLFESKAGGRYFGVKRFDRVGNSRLHMHTYGNLIHSDFRIPDQDYEYLLKIVGNMTKDLRFVHDAFRLMVFNVVMHNRDDHVKNFSFLMTPEGAWRFAPPYDLTFSPGTNGWHATTILEEGLRPTVSRCLELAAKVGVDKRAAVKIAGQVVEASRLWVEEANKAGLSTTRIAEIERAIIRS